MTTAAVELRDVREFLALLNPQVCRFDIGSGRIGGMTAQDVAAAVGMICNTCEPKDRPFLELGREIMLHAYWPDGAALSRDQLDKLIAQHLYEELSARDARWREAKLELMIAQDEFEDALSHTEASHQRLQRLKARADALASLRFPHQPELWPTVRRAVLSEIWQHRACPVCQGRGQLVARQNAPARKCEPCMGTGREALSDRQRAERLVRDESTYRERWRAMYEWLFALLARAEDAAARRLETHLFANSKPPEPQEA